MITRPTPSPRALLSHGPFRVRCDMCGKEYVYKRSEVLRIERELPRHSFLIRYFVMMRRNPNQRVTS